MKDFVNLFACLVHEKPDAIWDMVSNLRYLDPTSYVLLYNNSNDAGLLEDARFHCDAHVIVHPATQKHHYGALHGYMIDCMEWACQRIKFDTITNVDSDQVLLHPGYTECLAQIMDQNPNLGLLQSSPATPAWPSNSSEAPGGRRFLAYPQRTALTEFGHWRPFLTKYEGVFGRFPQWTFWPGTVFSRQACQAILRLLDNSLLLRTLIRRSRMFATEEVILPTLADVAGLDLVRTPFDETCLRFKTVYALDTLEESLSVPDRFWMHPVPRDLNDPLRAYLREYYHQYQE